MVISDTSSITNLYQIGEIDLLRKLFREVVITPGVQRELLALASQASIENIAWIKVIAPSNKELTDELLGELDAGEAESIALAVEKKASYLIIDEYKGRLIAERYNVKIVGLLGLLIRAKQQGLVSSVKDEVDKLLQIGFRLNAKLIADTLKKIGEA